MFINFTKHALVKLEQRRIRKQFVLDVIENPEFTKPIGIFKQEVYKKFGRQYLKVVVVRKKESVTVITMHWVAKMKYLL